MRSMLIALLTAAVLAACGGDAPPAADAEGAGGGAAGTCLVGTEDCEDADLGTPTPAP